MNKQHTAWMQQAIAEARRGDGLTRPNPPVGAVIVKDGQLLAKGYHRKAGGDHAEKAALKMAGAAAQGATMYVTLEPCCTQGRTPPCTASIIQAGIREVVVGAKDPNPAHNGRGIRLLRRNGITVSCGVCRRETEELIGGFVHLIEQKLPFVTLKMALSMDGRIADRTGRSKWITGQPARRYVQALRRRADAVMVGANTVCKDDPSLLPRPARGRKPLRVILDSEGIIPYSAQVLNDAAVSRTIVAVTERAAQKHVDRIRKRGAEVLVLRADKKGADIDQLLQELGRRDVMNLLCEGGGMLAGSLLQQNRVNRLEWFIAPCLIGSDGLPVVGLENGWLMENKPEFSYSEVRQLGKDVLLRVDIQ
jgi:diaminohydroxyphosphoribosylaminopyrimidine deaminase/5-amino-6-(5-phosphoribosylamino)uracil reductase